MGYITEIYKLPTFSTGETYSASLDRKRFTIIDNEMAFLSDFIGEGVIEGWNVYYSDGYIHVSPGMGLIGRNVVEIFQDYRFEYDASIDLRIYAKKRDEIISGIGPTSNVDFISADDTTPPQSPPVIYSPARDSSGLILSDLNTYNQISLSWDENTEVDFHKYLVYREHDGVDTFVSESSIPFYIDGELEPDTEYTYRVVSIDYSGNESPATDIVISTLPDLRQPAPPSGFRVNNSQNLSQFFFYPSTSNFVNRYTLRIDRIDIVGSVIDTVHSVDINEDGSDSYVYNMTGENFLSGSRYVATIYSTSLGGVTSEDISVIFIPDYIDGVSEISNLDISFEKEEVNPHTIFSINLDWDYIETDTSDTSGSSYSLPDGFKIQIIEVSDGNIIGEEMFYRRQSVSSGGGYSLSLDLFPAIIDGSLSNLSFKEYTPYIITIKSIFGYYETDGYIYLIDRTPVYAEMGIIENLSYERINTQDYLVSWTNPNFSYFSHNIVRLKNIDTGSYYTDLTNIGSSSTYLISSEYTAGLESISIEFTSYDIFGNYGETLEYTVLMQQIAGIPSPPNVNLLSTDSGIKIQWTPDTTGNISYYEIYKSQGNDILSSFNNFVMIEDGLPSDITEIIDYSVVDGETYLYLIVAVDFAGNKSYDPNIQGRYPDFKSIVATSRGAVPAMSDITLSQIGAHSVKISWSIDDDIFDGYQIYRSVSNWYSFRLIGQVSLGVAEFIDDASLIISGEPYFYMVRKFRDGGDYILSDSLIPPSDSILLASIKGGDVSGESVVDTSVRRHIGGFRDPILDILLPKINGHNHRVENGVDKRIDLSEDEFIQDWTTVNYKEYITGQDLEEGITYSVKVSGEINERFFRDESGRLLADKLFYARQGLSPVSYSLSGNSIIFVQPLYDTCILNTDADSDVYQNCKSPYLSPPTISVIAFGQSEVDGVLPQQRVDSIFANQISSGVLHQEQIPQISHTGRISERLVPLQIPLYREGSLIYRMPTNYQDFSSSMVQSDFGTATTFYRVIELIDGTLIAATSRGLLRSMSLGSSWSTAAEIDDVIYDIFITIEWGLLAIGSKGVYWTRRGEEVDWVIMSGTSGISIIYSVCSDKQGNAYLGTDIGIYKLNYSKSYIGDVWEKLRPIDDEYISAYALHYDEEEDKLYASNDIGLFYSTDEGLSWTYIDEITLFDRINYIYQYNNCLFALSNRYLYRKEIGSGEFDIVSILPSSAISAYKMQSHNDKLYLLTNNGPYVSVGTNDVCTAEMFLFTETLGELGVMGNRPVSFSLDKIQDKLFIGFERRLFFVDINGKIGLQYDEINSIIPTFYLNDESLSYRYFYSNTGRIVLFYSPRIDDIIYVSNRYNTFYSLNGGWANSKVDATYFIYRNKYPIFVKSDETLSFNSFNNIEFPIFTDENSHYEDAISSRNRLSDMFRNIYLTGATAPDISSDVSSAYSEYNIFLSRLYPKQRFVSTGGTFTYFRFPSILSNGSPTSPAFGSAVVDVSAGRVEFSRQFDKYDIMEIDIEGAGLLNIGNKTHAELEDKFELVYSGLTEDMSQTYQVNLLKLGFFAKSELEWSDANEKLSQQYIYNSEDIISNLDTLNSTVNCDEIDRIDLDDTSLTYVCDTEYFNGKIYIGGDNRLVSLDPDSLDISVINISLQEWEGVRRLRILSGRLYILTKYRIYSSIDMEDIQLEVTNGLPSDLYDINLFHGVYILSANDGIYIKPSTTVVWSKVVSSESAPQCIYSREKVVIFSDGKFYLSLDGYTYNEVSNLVGTPDNLEVYDIERINNFLYFATNNGIYTDSGSFDTSSPRIYLIKTTEGIPINSLRVYSNVLYASASESQYITVVGTDVRIFKISAMPSIISLIVNSIGVYLFGANRTMVPNIDYPIIIGGSNIL